LGSPDYAEAGDRKVPLMDIAEPSRAVVPTLDGPVLRTLVSSVMPASARELARRVGRGSEEGIRRVLNRLVHQGVVLAEPAGASVQYRLNVDHVAFDVVRALAQLRPELLRRIANWVQAWDPAPTLAGVYGSFARGEGDAESDIDLLVVGEDVDDDDVAALAERIRAWTGNSASVAVLSRADLRRVIDAGESIVGSWERDFIPVLGSLRTATA
jgi:predicted nucleotidyltransferase